MVSFEHQVVIEFARHRGELLREILPAGHKRKELSLLSSPASSDLSLVPKQYLADQITLYREQDGTLRFAILLEVQQSKDDMKEWTWPVYVGVARAHHQCPVLLMVIALKRRAERWARALIKKDLPSWGEAPVVISARDIPIVDDVREIRSNPQLAVLSVMAHPSLKLAEIVLKALKGRLEQDQARLYCEAVMRALTLKDRSTLEAKMNKGIVYRSAYARKYLDEGHEKGMTKGMAKGRKEGRKEGRQEGMAEAQRTLQQTAMQLARLKLEDITREEQAALSTMRDTKVLSGLVLQLAKAKQPQQARKALAKAELAARKKQEKSGRGAEQSSLAFA
jgi:hypothetical protein